MIKLNGARLYLAVLEKEDCVRLTREREEDFANPTDAIYIGFGSTTGEEWYDEIQKQQHKENIWLGIFLNDGTVIGDVALQGIDWRNRCCSLGMSFAKLENRGKGYGYEAARLMLHYAFEHMGLERVSADTLDINDPGKRSLEKLGFKLEGLQRRAVWLLGRWVDKPFYAILKDEFMA